MSVSNLFAAKTNAVRFVCLFVTASLLFLAGCAKQLADSTEEHAIKVKDELPSVYQPVEDNVKYDIDRVRSEMKD
jgi:hypothetical protein